MKKIIAILCSLCVLTTLISCASNNTGEKAEKPKKEKTEKSKKGKKSKSEFTDEAYLEALQSGDYETCISMLISLGDKMDISQQFDLGMLQHYTNDYQTASETMETTTTAIDDAFTQSITRNIGAAVVSEGISEYSGNIYEYLLIDAFNALNYYKNGDMDSAYSRVVRVSDKQKEYVGKYGEIALKDDDSSEEDNNQLNDVLEKANIPNPLKAFEGFPKKPTEENLYKTSAFADYLQIVLAAQNGSNIDEYIVKELNTIAPDVETDSAELSKDGRIEVLALGGQIAQRSEHAEFWGGTLIEAPLQALAGGAPIEHPYLKFVWPEYQPSKNRIYATKVTLNDGTSKPAVLLEDFDLACANDVLLNAKKAAVRSVIRSTITKITGMIAANVTYQASVQAAANLPGPLQAKTLQKAVETLNVGIDALDLKELADIRQAKALPSTAYVAGFTVAPGTYSITVEYSNGFVETIDNVVVQAGKPILVESVCSK